MALLDSARFERTACAPPAADLRVACEPAFDFLGAEYGALFAASDATAFQHPIWLDAFYRHLAPARGAESAVVAGRDGDGRLRFVLPLILRRRGGFRLLEATDLGVGDYAAPVIERRWLAGRSAPAGIGPLVGRVLPGHDLVRIRPVRAEHVAGWEAALGGRTKRLGFSAHAASLAGGHDGWRERLDPSFRRYLDRKRRRLFKLPGARVARLDAPEAAADAIRTLARLREGRFEGDMIALQCVRDFYAEVAARGAASGFASSHVLEAGGETMGHAFGICSGGRFHFLLIGCDYARHGRHSPGLALYDGMIAAWAGRGGEVFDFTIGDEAYKADMATEPTAMFELRGERGLRGVMARAALDVKERLGRMRRGAAAGTATPRKEDDDG